MKPLEQLSLFPIEQPEIQVISETDLQELGTFKDNVRAPIHGWFKYPAGYSYRFVFDIFDQFRIHPGEWVYDMFSGTGTTLICAKQKGINGYGVEAHSFVHWVADVKLYWDFDYTAFGYELTDLLKRCRNHINHNIDETATEGVFPELVYKCYHPLTLKQLYLLRGFIFNQVIDVHVQDLLKLALTDTLRAAAAAGTGWPYIAPNKNTGDKPPKPALAIFEKTVWKMYADLGEVTGKTSTCEIYNILGDARSRQHLEDGQISIAITSPPYLNNYDYADRTRLETYFWGITSSWKDITEQFRNKLMVAATTQIIRKQHHIETVLSEVIKQVDTEVYGKLYASVQELARLRLTKGGKKDYDLMVALYFNDMLAVLQEAYRVLKPGGTFCLVLGDSAPYGVHIETENLIGQLGLGLGFQKFEYQEFRTRGGKWKANPQRHTVKLREGVVQLTK